MGVLNPSGEYGFSLLLGGGAGQGLQTVESLVARLARLSGYHLFAAREYMSRVRGGCNSVQIRLSSRRVTATIDTVDLFIALSGDALHRYSQRISPQTLLVSDPAHVNDEMAGRSAGLVDIAFGELAREAGGTIYASSVVTGFICGMVAVEQSLMERCLHETFDPKGTDSAGKNIAAAQKGYERGRRLAASGRIGGRLKEDAAVCEEILLNGAEAVALGAIAGGCNFISAYPMSPSTGVLTFLSKHAKAFNIVADQAEDELAAINAVAGAWFAGGRAMASTSGGGFALMTEGVSLIGMIESPAVIHIAQRPGPATGLPTRMEQGDLDLALYAGHGEFPRIILAPGNALEAFHLTQNAFNLAARYQSPVFILTDQYLIDSRYNVPIPSLDGMVVEQHIVKTGPDYRRYVINDEGISPRGIPAFGEGLVGVDSDEHDEAGHITEDLTLRSRMVEKRLQKLAAIKRESVPPTLKGPADCRLLLIGWGSTLNIVSEALDILACGPVAFLHFSQLYPLPEETAAYLERAERTAVIENNATGQFARLIQRETGRRVDHLILKYNGLPFTVEEVAQRISALLEEEAK